VSRAALVPIGETIGTVPRQSERASKYAGYDSSGNPTVLEALSSTAAVHPNWVSILTDDPSSEAEAYIVVDTISELQNLTGAEAEDVVRLLGRTSAGDGAEGLYYWVAGDQSSSVTTDEVTASAGNGGIWVAPSTDLTGASGAWKRANIDAVSVKWYGAIGDNTADDTDAVQAAIAGANSVSSKTVYFPAGTYKCDEQLILNSGARWIGDGPALSTVKFDSGLGNNIAIRTATTSGTINVFDQSNIELIGLHIQGFDAVLTTTASETHSPLIRFWKIDSLNIDRCKFSGHRFIMCSLGGVKNFSISRCEFEDWGRTDDLASSGTLPVNEGGAALWIAANPIDDTKSSRGSITECYFHDSEWSAVYIFGDYITFHNNRVFDTKEGIYARATDVGTNNDAFGLVFSDNHIKGVTKRHIQAAGLELGGKSLLIKNNTIEGCAAPAIDLTDTCEEVSCSGNMITDCATSADFSEYGQITVRATNVTVDAIDGVTVSDNVIRGASSYYGIRLYRPNGTDLFENIRVFDNDLLGAASSASNYLTFTESELGSNCQFYNNSGCASRTWTPTVSASSGTITTATVNAAYFQQIGSMVNFNVVITITDNGTGAGVLRFTLPSTPAIAGSGTGTNATNARALSVQWGTTTTVNVYEYQGNYPVSTGEVVRVCGQYFVA
jgi:hypothetical protein